MNKSPKIAILLATYNGSRFLSEQLDSILSQTYTNFILVVRDDCSTDNTRSMLEDYRQTHADKMHLLEPDVRNQGASASFSCLLEYVLQHKQVLELDRAYMMFCDQDDVWYSDKIERQVQSMLAAEAAAVNLPVLVHSDLEVVSEALVQIAPSFIRYQGLEIQRNQFCQIVISNLVTGCTAFINEALARQACPVPQQAIMHDWWLALVATAFGKLVLLDAPLVHYRQHGRNTIGAKEHAKLPVISLSLWQRVFARKPNEHLYEVARQAREFSMRYGRQLSWRQRSGLRVSAAMRVRSGFLQRLCYRVARCF